MGINTIFCVFMGGENIHYDGFGFHYESIYFSGKFNVVITGRDLKFTTSANALTDMIFLKIKRLLSSTSEYDLQILLDKYAKEYVYDIDIIELTN